MSIRNAISSLLIVAALTGCSSYSQWTQIQQDSPWGADHNRVTTWRRTETPSWLMVVGAPLSEQSWKINGKYVNTYDVSKSITGYLSSIGYIERQRTTNAFSDNIQERVAENRFFIVSLKPTVVVMTPYKVGRTEGKSAYDLQGRLNEQVLDSSPLINGYHYGSKVIQSKEYKWFSPDLKSGIQSVVRYGSHWVISNENIRIVITQASSGAWYQVERQ